MKNQNEPIDIRDVLEEIIIECTGRQMDISWDTDLMEDLSLDSVDIFSVVAGVEKRFGITFDDVDLLGENFSRVEQFCDLIRRQLERVD